MKTPTTPSGLRKYDHLIPEEAAVRAWTQMGSHPRHHKDAVKEVRDAMPLLARALDRLAQEWEEEAP